MEEFIGVSSKKLHDYYHNTWSKQFFDSLDPLKNEIVEMVKLMGSSAKAAVLKQVIAHIEERYPEKRFHYQTLYQYINY